MLASEDPNAARLAEILRRSQPLRTALAVARAVDPPDWLIVAGAIRDAVWDHLHGREPTAMPRDVDLSFFDPGELGEEREQEVRAELACRAPDLPWDVRNQAAVHLWYPERFGRDVEPFSSSAEAVATFPEVASCVGVRRLTDGDLLVVAPHGLGDLLAGVCRHNPARAPAGLYEQRVASKGWRERWPDLRYIPA